MFVLPSPRPGLCIHAFASLAALGLAGCLETGGKSGDDSGELLDGAGLVVTTLDDVLDDEDGEVSLREALAFAVAQGGGEVTFAEGLAGAIALGSPLGLSGDPAVQVTITAPADGSLGLDGGGAVGLIALDGPSLAVSGLGLRGGWADFGGAIAVSAGALSLADVVLENNVGHIGGAIWMGEGAGALEVLRARFVANRAERFGGGIALQGAGGATLSELSFVDHGPAAEGDEVWGAAIYAAGGDLLAEELSVRGSRAQRGAIAFDASAGSLSVAGGELVDNHADEIGGAVFAQSWDDAPGSVTVSLVDLEVMGNSAEEGGGAIYGSGPGLALSLAGSRVETNLARGLRGGGAIYTTSDLALDGVGFVDNAAEAGDGGAVVLSGLSNDNRLDARDVIFSGNSSATSGGALSVGFMGGGRLLRCTFEDNTAAEYGGGAVILSSAEDVVIEDSELLSNVAGTQGGGLRLGTNTVLEGTLVSFNEAAYGGGAYVAAGATLVVGVGSEVSQNSATADGGPLRVGGGVCDRGELVIEGGTVAGNAPDERCSDR